MVNDVAIYMRALLFGDMYVLSDNIGNYRIHNSNISSCITKDFLISNMEERLWVSNHLQSKESKEWLQNQMIFCYSYYTRGSHPSLKDHLSIVIWILMNCSHSLKLYKKLLRVLIKESRQTLH